MALERENDRGKSFTRRALLIGAMQGGIVGVLGTRLAWLQIAQSQRYRTLSDNNRINIKMLAPSRGQILDRNDIPMAVNGQNFRVVVIPEQTSDLETALSRLQKLIKLSQHDIQRVIKQAQKNPPFVPLEVRDNLDWEEVARIEVNLPDLPGLSIDEGEVRYYPYDMAAAHLIGYVGAVSKGEVGDDPLLTLPGFKIGKAGVEKTFDGPLRGAAGTAEIEVNVLGREVREMSRKPGRQGSPLRLTIDAELQQFVHQKLSEKQSASAVVMDVHTGAVFALGSYPAYDPNVFSRGLSAELWEELLADPGLPLNNKAVGGQYPPGSTFKMVTAMAALEAGVINRNTTAFCPGFYDFGDNRFHCWKKPGHGTVNVVQALEQSCDTFFYKLAVDLGVDRIAAAAVKLGLGDKLGFELSEERPGLIPTKEWKMGRFGESWQPGESIVASIGQGYTLTTPLQLAVMVARLVNGGKAVKPWIAGFVGAEENVPREWPKIDFRKENIELVIQGMHDVMAGRNGTARASQLKDERFWMGGKTGTAQVRRITREDRAAGVKNEDLPWKFRHHALFVGYAPLSAPRYACAVVVEHGGGGSAAAAPVARDIMEKVQILDPASHPFKLAEERAALSSVPALAPVPEPATAPASKKAAVKAPASAPKPKKPKDKP